MPKWRNRRPSPALVISLVSLFVALGTGAYAASKIGTDQIRNGAVTTKKLANGAVKSKKVKRGGIGGGKLKKNAIGTSKVKNDAVTGAKVDESTLGVVPQAENSANFARYLNSDVKKASIGQTVELLSFGPFRIEGRCSDDGGGNPQATSYLISAENGASMFSDAATADGDLNAGEEAQVGVAASGGAPAYQFDPAASAWTAASADSFYLLHGYANTAVNLFGAQCAFQVWGFYNGPLISPD